MTALATSCIFPISADEVDPSGPQLRPVIISASPAMPGQGAVEENGTYIVRVEDMNLDDTLYVRVFREYDPQVPLAPLVDVEAPASGNQAVRDIELRTNTWCNGVTPDPDEPEPLLQFDVVVADRPFLSDTTIEPIYQAVDEPGLTFKASWLLKCLPESAV